MRMVLLRHDLPDGTGHFDWMIESAPPNSDSPVAKGTPGQGLITFRVECRIDLPGVDSFRAIHLPDHRREYLEYEGEVSQGRGRVTRIAAGIAESVVATAASVRIRGVLGEVRGVFVGRPVERDEWEFACQAEAGPAAKPR